MSSQDEIFAKIPAYAKQDAKDALDALLEGRFADQALEIIDRIFASLPQEAPTPSKDDFVTIHLRFYQREQPMYDQGFSAEQIYQALLDKKGEARALELAQKYFHV